MKIFITGANGFVGGHFLDLLMDRKIECEIIATYHSVNPQEKFLRNNIKWIKIDLTCKAEVTSWLQKIMPTHILHLAAKSSVAESYKQPGEVIHDNTDSFLNILEATRELKIDCKLLLSSSAEVYKDSQNILNENSELSAQSPYALSKILQEQIADFYADRYQMQIVVARSFNHIGPNQNLNFVLASFVKQLKDQIMQNQTQIKLDVGNIDVVRDFTDVRDVVRAYWLMLSNPTNFRYYNICCGKGYSLRNIIELMARKIQLPIELNIMPERLRPTDKAIVIGNSNRMQTEFLWRPEILLPETIDDMFATL